MLRDVDAQGQHHPSEHDSGMRWQPPVLTLQLRESPPNPLGTQAAPPGGRPGAAAGGGAAGGWPAGGPCRCPCPCPSRRESWADAVCVAMSDAAPAAISNPARLIFLPSLPSMPAFRYSRGDSVQGSLSRHADGEIHYPQPQDTAKAADLFMLSASLVQISDK